MLQHRVRIQKLEIQLLLEVAEEVPTRAVVVKEPEAPQLPAGLEVVEQVGEILPIVTQST
jgi:hypothetical protein